MPEKVERRHHHERKPVVQARQPRGDQAHAVVQRKPAHEHIIVSHTDGLAHRADVGEQLRVAEHDALRAAGAAGRVLEKAVPVSVQDAGGSRVGRPCRPSSTVATARNCGISARSNCAAGIACRVLIINTACALARMPAWRRTCPSISCRRAGRIDRHRNGAGQQDSEMGMEKADAGRQHDCYRLPRLHTVALQPGADAPRAVVQLGVTQRSAVGDSRTSCVRAPSRSTSQRRTSNKVRAEAGSSCGAPRRRAPDCRARAHAAATHARRQPRRWRESRVRGKACG